MPTSTRRAGTGHLPAYRKRLTLGQLEARARELHALLKECTVCPRECGARRLDGRIGVCHSTDEVVIASVGPHYGEEPPLVGYHGSGTVFFASCNLKCAFCQNYDISQLRHGHPVSLQHLAEQMLSLQALGCHNINLVTPTHFTPQIVEALALAVAMGLSIPIVYNCGGYESAGTLKLLDDIVDIYMPDIKYSDDEHARQYSGVKDYWEVVQAAVREMHRQVGDLHCDERGVAERGLIIRHLVLPHDLAGSKQVLDFVAREVSRETYINIMDQYHPFSRAHHITQLDRCVTSREYHDVLHYARRQGLHRGFEGQPERFL